MGMNPLAHLSAVGSGAKRMRISSSLSCLVFTRATATRLVSHPLFHICAILKSNMEVSHAARFKCESSPMANQFKARALLFSRPPQDSLKLLKLLLLILKPAVQLSA